MRKFLASLLLVFFFVTNPIEDRLSANEAGSTGSETTASQPAGGRDRESSLTDDNTDHNPVGVSAPRDVPWPATKFESFARFPPSGSGIRVDLDDSRWVELNSLATSGTKLNGKQQKVFWTPDGQLINPPPRFDPLQLVPASENDALEKVSREALIQIVAPKGATCSIDTGGLGGYGKLQTPINRDFVQFPIQCSMGDLKKNHTYVDVKITKSQWEELPQKGHGEISVYQSDESRRLVILADDPQSFAWQAGIQYEDEETTTIGAFVTGTRLDGNFVPDDIQSQVPREERSRKAVVFAFSKKKSVPKVIGLQRSRYDSVRFDNLAVFPGPRSAVKVSVNGRPTNEDQRYELLDQENVPELTPVALSANEKAFDPIALNGRVVNSAGNAVANAWVGMFVEPKYFNEHKSEASPFELGETFVTETNTDSDGKFSIVAPKDHSVFDGSFWAIDPEGGSGSIRMNCVWSYLQKNLKIKIHDETAMVRIRTPERQNLENASVSLEAIRQARGATQRIPQMVQEKLARSTNADGDVQFGGWSSAALRGLAIEHPDFGTQYLSDHLASNWAQENEPLLLTLRPTARLQGQVAGYNADRDAKLQLLVRTEDWSRGASGPPLYGRAIVGVDAEGRFEVAKIVAGRVSMESSLDSASNVRMRFPRIKKLRPGEDRKLSEAPEIVPAVVVRQQIVKADTGEGIPGMKLLVLWGEAVEGRGGWNSSRAMTTDQDGWWTAKVLAGTINARISSVPKGYQGTAWFDGRNGYLGVEHEIPQTDQVVTLPKEVYVSSKKLSGRLQFNDGSPAVDWSVYGHPISWHDVGVGGVDTDREGRFTWTYPNGYPPRLYNASNREWMTQHDFRENYVYPKVISQEPFVLEIPAQLGSRPTLNDQ